MTASARSAAALILCLGGCQTTDDSAWIGDGGTPYNWAERSCSELTEQSIAEESERAEFFVGCMKALGWAPRPGSEFAQPETAPDPA